MPSVLKNVILRKRVQINLSPFEILFGRPSSPGLETGASGRSVTGAPDHPHGGEGGRNRSLDAQQPLQTGPRALTPASSVRKTFDTFCVVFLLHASYLIFIYPNSYISSQGQVGRQFLGDLTFSQLEGRT